MIRQGVRRTVVLLPQGRDRFVDVLQDLVRGLVSPVGGAARPDGGRQPRHGRVVHQAGRAYLAEAFIDVPVDQLVAVQPDAFVQEGFGIAADAHHLLALHDGKRHVLREIEAPGDRLGHVRLDDGDVVGHVEEEVVVLPAGGGVGHVDGRDGLQEASAGNDRHVAGPLRSGQGLEDGLVDLLELLHEEGVSVIGRHAAARSGRGMNHRA